MRKPLEYACKPCDWQYPMGVETTIYQYLEQPWFNHLDTTCPRCERRNTVWNLQEETLLWLEEANMSDEDPVQWAMPQDTAEGEIIIKWLKEYINFRSLTEHQIHEAQFFAWLLDHREDIEWHDMESA